MAAHTVTAIDISAVSLKDDKITGIRGHDASFGTRFFTIQIIAPGIDVKLSTILNSVTYDEPMNMAMVQRNTNVNVLFLLINTDV